MWNSLFILFLFLLQKPGFAGDLSAFSLRDGQRASLEVLANTNEVQSELRKIAREKLNFFSKTGGAKDALEMLINLPRNQRTQLAAEFALTTFTSHIYDPIFREYLIKFLGKSELSNETSLKILLPLARGLGKVRPREISWAARSISEISGRMGSYPLRP
ncbi:MAG: hypothetical protein ABIQ95_00330, partial [Bdellovibrionia bacterium]